MRVILWLLGLCVLAVGLTVAVPLPADDNARALYRTTHFQSADVIKLGSQLIRFGKVGRGKVPYPQRQKQHPGETDRHEETNPQIKQPTTHQAPRNINEVNTKSSARIASAEYTTVRLIEPETPSAVGMAS